MSRLGKKPIPIPSGVEVSINGRSVTMKGALGTTTIELPDTNSVETAVADGAITVRRTVENNDSSREQGLVRSLLNNQMIGVSEGYKRELDIVGVGYKAEVKGDELLLSVGFASPKVFRIPKHLKVTVEKGVRIFLASIDKWTIGQAAAQIRKVRPPEPYKGKGIRYYDEKIKRKVGKTAVGAGG